MEDSYTGVYWNHVMELRRGTLRSTNMIIIVMLVSMASFNFKPTLVYFSSTNSLYVYNFTSLVDLFSVDLRIIYCWRV